MGYDPVRDCEYIPLVWRLISTFVDIALHRRGPEHIPASQFLLALLLLVYLIVGFVALKAGESLDGRTGLYFVADSFFYFSYVWVVLKVFKLQQRFLQTVSALVGVDVLMNLLGIPLLVWNRASALAEPAATVPTLLFVLLFFWSIDVAGHIVSKALGRAYFSGVVVIVTYVICSMIVRDWVFEGV